MTDLLNERVISCNHPRPMIYGGPHPSQPGRALISYNLHKGGLPVLSCDPSHVAPADIPIPEKDDRVIVEKLPARPFPEASGPWALRIDGIDGASYYRTKRDALATGLRRVAISDWHADLVR